MLSPNALTVLDKRYLKRDEEGRVVETPDQMWDRVSSHLAQADALYGASPDEVAKTAASFRQVMADLLFLPNSPTLANAGARTGQLSACFVVPVPDDLAGIFEAVKAAALIHQTGGGTGFSFSRLRPKGDVVKSSKGVSSGPISFMEVFNAATESIKQGGMRRGANMGILRVDHPDIADFIAHKADLTKLTNFNVSVAITDAFMAAVEEGTSYALVNPRTGEEAGRLDAREVFRDVVARAWATGEPGVVFIDRMNRDCPVPWMGGYEATNPCGEQPLLPYESCNLGSLNLERFVDGWSVDWASLRRVVHVATHLLDNVIDMNVYPHPEIERVSKGTRKIGLGVMGFARMLFKLGTPYGSLDAAQLAEKVMAFIDLESKRASIALARTRGAFPALAGHEQEFIESVWMRWGVERHGVRLDLEGLPRNSTTTTVAPTGTLSIIADTSGGCEPVFGLAFKRWQADTHMVDVDQVFAKALEARAGHAAGLVVPEVLEGLTRHHGSLKELLASGELSLQAVVTTKGWSDAFTVAHDVTPAQHVAIQAAFQRYNDSATSKTINFPEGATAEEVAEAYRLAWATGCKGITVYRDKCRDAQPLSTGEAKPADTLAQAIAPAEKEPLPYRPRPEVLAGETCQVETGDGRLYLTMNFDDEGLREVVANVGRSGGTLFSLTEAIGRLVSLALKYRVPVVEVARSLMGIRGPNPMGFGPNQVLSIPDAIGKAIAKRVHFGPMSGPYTLNQGLLGSAEMTWANPDNMTKTARLIDPVDLGLSPECPECGSGVEHGEGCVTCRSCGWSKCG